MDSHKAEETPSREMEQPKVAVCLLTCGRPALTVKTWQHNLPIAGYPYDLFWYDNGSTQEDYLEVYPYSEAHNIVWHESAQENAGIALGLNRLIYAAFERGYDMVMTMANDILEPDNWLLKRVRAAQTIPNTGAVGIAGTFAAKYSEKTVNNMQIMVGGDIIGNWLITKESWEKVGLFCTDYGLYGPLDLDYCYRMKKSGLRYYYCVGQDAIHLGTPEEASEEYTRAKRESLRDSSQQYSINMQLYQGGKKLYQCVI